MFLRNWISGRNKRPYFNKNMTVTFFIGKLHNVLLFPKKLNLAHPVGICDMFGNGKLMLSEILCWFLRSHTYPRCNRGQFVKRDSGCNSVLASGRTRGRTNRFATAAT